MLQFVTVLYNLKQLDLNKPVKRVQFDPIIQIFTWEVEDELEFEATEKLKYEEALFAVLVSIYICK